MGILSWLRPSKSTETQRPAQTVTGTSVSPTRRPVFAVVDVETTGLTPASDRILELSIIRCDAAGIPVDEWTSRFNPEGPVGATHIHGISAADVATAPLFGPTVPELSARLAGLVVVAHNARFDLAFLRSEYGRAGWSMPFVPSLCTLEESRRYLPTLARRRLPDCCEALGVQHVAAHSALGDSRAAASLLACYLAASAGHGLYDGLFVQASGMRWPTEPSGAPIVGSTPPRAALRIRATPPPRTERLVELLNDLDLAGALPEGAPEGAASYLELLAEVVEDGVLTDDEAAALGGLAELYELSGDVLRDVHACFLVALARKAVDDGKVSHSERAELYAVASLLEVPKARVLSALDIATAERNARNSEGLSPLPDGWSLGEPLRVGNAVVFTGCDEDERTMLEARATSRGVKVASSVSGATSILVTDGSFTGGKLDAARRLGTRITDPATFAILLDHLQPALERVAPRPAPATAISAPGVLAPAATPRSNSGINPSAVRAWARSQGYEVGERGRLPQGIFDAYAAASGSQPPADGDLA